MEIKCMGMDNAVKSNLQNSYSKLIERFKGKTRISNLMNSFSSTLIMSFILDQIDHHFRDRDDCPIIFIVNNCY